MKKIIYSLLVVCAMIVQMGCEREYDAPPIAEPKYEGPAANTTISSLKQRYASLTSPQLIEEDLIIKGFVTGNDESGNIYKQIYLQDESSAINIGVDQNSIYAAYQVGQEVYMNLKGLFILKYGGELQIGMGSTNANRISWEMFKEHAIANSWPDAKRVTPRVVELTSLTDDMVHTLVEIRDITFTNGGKNAFTTGDATTNEQIKNASGNVLDVRTSNFSDFAKDKLPVGKGNIVGMLGRFNGSWQLVLRTKADVGTFDGIASEGEKPIEGTFFRETFGTGTYPSGNRPKINEFTDFDQKAPVKYEDASGWADIRSVTGDNGAHIWLPANREATVKITGINTTGKGTITLTYQLAANLFDAGSQANLNQIQIRINGDLRTIPSQDISNAAGDNGKFYTISVPNIPEMANLTIEFISAADRNTIGFRLDNITLLTGTSTSGGGNPIVVGPSN